MRRDACGDRIGGIEPFSGKRAIGAELAGQARQEPRRSYIGKKADANLGHRESEPVARHAVRAVNRDADAAAHDDAVDQRHIGLAVVFDAGIERIFGTKELERFRMTPGAAEVIEGAKIAACRKGAPAIRGYDHAHDRRIALPLDELLRERAHHDVRDGIERARPIEDDVARHALALEQDVGFGHGSQLPSMSLLMINRITSLVPSRIWWTRKSRKTRSIGWSCR